MTDQTPGTPAEEPTPGSPAGEGGEPLRIPDDISGIDNFVEEGAPLEPSDIAETEAVRAAAEQIAAANAKIHELTDDLKRKQAELVNYRARVERDRELTQQNAKYAVLAPIVEVLDTIDRAREHGELEGGLKAVAEQLERTVTSQGLSKFGAVGDPFDPTVHEALSHLGEDPDVTVQTCKVIAKAGYKIGDRVVRAAQVLVVDPPAGSAAPQESAPQKSTEG